jgi:hypothetical protein
MEVEVAHGVEGIGPLKKWMAALLGISAVVAASLATLDLHASKNYEDLVNRSSRLSVELFGRIAGSSFPVTAEAISSQAATLRGIQSSAREVLSTVDPQVRGFEAAIAQADRAASERLTRLAELIGEVPSPESGVDPTIRDVIGTQEDRLNAIADRQNRLLDESTRHSNRSSRAVFALSLVALTTVLLGLAAVMGARSGAAFLVGGAGVLLLVAVGWGATAFLE